MKRDLVPELTTRTHAILLCYLIKILIKILHNPHNKLYRESE